MTFPRMDEKEDGNPDLLEGIFREESDGSESETESDNESMADLILRAARTLGKKSGFLNKWIQDADKQFYFSQETGKLICYSVTGKYLEYLGGGRYVPYGETESGEKVFFQAETIADSASQKTCWVTEMPPSILRTIDRSGERKRVKLDPDSSVSSASMSVSDLLEAAQLRVEGISEFSGKWSLEEPSLRHLFKMDRLMVSYIVKHFSPVKAKARNALHGMIESLSSFPQKWRIHSLKEENLLEECPTRHVADAGSLRVQTEESVDEHLNGSFILEANDDADTTFTFDILNIENDFFLLNSGNGLLVDGMRVVPSDGPVPLTDGSIISLHPYHMLLVEVGVPEHRISRRNR